MIIMTLIIGMGCLGWCFAAIGWTMWWMNRAQLEQLLAQPILIQSANGDATVRRNGAAVAVPPVPRAEVIPPELDAEARVLRAVSSATKDRAVDWILQMAKDMKMNLSREDATKQVEALYSLDAPEMPYVV